MLKVIKELLLKIVDDIDAGNSNITNEEALELANTISVLANKDRRMSKYAACQYLNVSRATFDNYVKEGKLPKGKHDIGFKELSWSRRDLDNLINRLKNNFHNI
jgi:predicted DNA-binding transcriptional regulator AlpA